MKTHNGFTLVELMITIAVAVILLAAAVPGFRNLIMDNRLTTQANDLVAALHLARAEAVKRGTTVSVCTSSNGTGCTATSWNNGWIVFVDENTAGTVDGNDTVLRVFEALASGITLTASGFSNANYLQYQPTGILSGSGGTFVLCDSRGAASARAIVVSGVGSAQKAVDTNNDGTVEDINGQNVTCP